MQKRRKYEMIVWTNKHKIIQETFIAVHASCIQKEKKNTSLYTHMISAFSNSVWQPFKWQEQKRLSIEFAILL